MDTWLGSDKFSRAVVELLSSYSLADASMVCRVVDRINAIQCSSKMKATLCYQDIEM